MSEGELVDLARRIAHEAHTVQTDKAGEPYIGHPQRVAERLTSSREQAVAWLHDVIEDTLLTGADLLRRGIPDDVVRSVLVLTRPHDEPYEVFIRRIKDSGDQVAIAVKRADFADNSNEERLAKLDPEEASKLRAKYAGGIAILDGRRHPSEVGSDR